MKTDIDGLTRTDYCGNITKEQLNKEVTVYGWVNSWRDHGGVIFIDLRDRTGIIQIVFDPSDNKETHNYAQSLRSEYCVAARGHLRSRPEGTINPNLATGEVELLVDCELRILSESKTPPFPLSEADNVGEDRRLKYRYMDLRREKLQKNLIIRHKTVKAVRDFYDKNGFIEVETPVLTKSTPEGARDYLVPSRVNKEKFYALPQSPQLFKQLLMIAGFDRYFQVVKCFRDEDLRADRQPEFTQIDVESSFVNEEDVISVSEKMLQYVFRNVLNFDIPLPIPRMTHKEAMDRFGTDKPDIRFPLELVDVGEIFKKTGFGVFKNVLEKGGQIKLINAEAMGDMTRRQIDRLTALTACYGAKGLAWIKVKADLLQSPIIKFFSDNEKKELLKKAEARPGDLLFFVADTKKVVADSLSHLRLELAKIKGYLPNKNFSFLWVTDFPLFEWSDTEERFLSMHHPFTAPFAADLEKYKNGDLSKIRSRAYDITLNGNEIGGGSIRINRSDLQLEMLNLLRIDEKEARQKFGFLLDALNYGAPPHGGIAFGLDRIIMLMVGADSIRDVIAFPKTQRAYCPLTDAPSSVTAKQLRELHIRTIV